jgi:hypothetical protein
MPTAQLNCPKCKSNMIEGFIVDQGYGRRFISQWVEGAPRPAFGWAQNCPTSEGSTQRHIAVRPAVILNPTQSEKGYP